MNNRDILLSLVRYAINKDAIDIEAVREAFNSERAATLFKIAKKHDIAHLVSYALRENGINAAPSIKERLDKEEENAHFRYEMIKKDIKEICSCFESEGIAYILLKGAELRLYYPQPWMRTSCDVDILVRENDLTKAINALVEKCKFTSQEQVKFHDVSLYSPFGMHLELHHNIKENVKSFDKILTQVWDFSKKQGESYEYKMENEFFIFHHIAHMAYHFVGGGCGLRFVLDLWLLQQQIEIDQRILDGLLEKAELKIFYATVCELCEYWFGNSYAVSPLTLETEKHILLGGVYGTKKRGAMAAKIKKGGKLGYFKARLFLPYESLAILYPIVKKYKILIPFCHMARLVKSIFKRKKISREIKRVLSIDEEESKSLGALLNSLGL